MKTLNFVLVFAFAGFMVHGASVAEVVSAGGAVKILNEPPTTVVPNTRYSMQSNLLQVFNEKQNLKITEDGRLGRKGDLISSHYIFYDPDLSGSVGRERYRRFSPPASIVFDGEIVLVIKSDIELDETDEVFGLDIRYPYGLVFRGTDSVGETDDSFSYSGNRMVYRTLFVRDSGTEPGTDHVRLITRKNQ